MNPNIGNVISDEEAAAIWQQDFARTQLIIKQEAEIAALKARNKELEHLKVINEDLRNGLQARIEILELAFERHEHATKFEQESKDATDALHFANASIKQLTEAKDRYKEALSNLLAVIHRDGGHRIEEVGMLAASKEAEKIVAAFNARPVQLLTDDLIDKIVPALDPASEDYPAEWALWQDRERIRKELRNINAANGITSNNRAGIEDAGDVPQAQKRIA